jgi:predicted lysophospholipase L1 biosynthesis ABC-type transport system permease subunit
MINGYRTADRQPLRQIGAMAHLTKSCDFILVMLVAGLIAAVGLNARGRVVITIQFEQAINRSGHVNGNVIEQLGKFHSSPSV